MQAQNRIIPVYDGFEWESDLSGKGETVKRFERDFAEWAGYTYAVAFNSGTSAIEGMLAADRQATHPGIGSNAYEKELCVPVNTIISCASAAVRSGWSVTFRDAGKDKNTPDNKQKRNVLLVHQFGQIDRTKPGKVVTAHDCSQYWLPPGKNRKVFKHDQSIAYSLYANKIVTTGEGGIVVTNDEKKDETMREYRDLCFREVEGERFQSGLSGNYRMSAAQANVGITSLTDYALRVKERQRVRDLYEKHLPSDDYNFITKRFQCEIPWMFLIEVGAPAGEVVKIMYHDHGIECRRYFKPITDAMLQPNTDRGAEPFKFPDHWKNEGPFPRARLWYDRCLYLPSGYCLTEDDICRIVTSLKSTLRSIIK